MSYGLSFSVKSRVHCVFLQNFYGNQVVSFIRVAPAGFTSAGNIDSYLLRKKEAKKLKILEVCALLSYGCVFFIFFCKAKVLHRK